MVVRLASFLPHLPKYQSYRHTPQCLGTFVISNYTIRWVKVHSKSYENVINTSFYSLPSPKELHPNNTYSQFFPILRSCQPLIFFLSLFIYLLRPFPINRITLALWCLAYFMDHVFKVYLCGCESAFFPCYG